MDTKPPTRAIPKPILIPKAGAASAPEFVYRRIWLSGALHNQDSKSDGSSGLDDDTMGTVGLDS